MEGLSLLSIGPEVVLVLAAVFVLTAEVTLQTGPKGWAPLATAGFVMAIVLSVVQWNTVADGGASLHFGAAEGIEVLRRAMIAMDGFSAFAGLAIFTVAGLGLMAAWDLVKKLETRGAEFVALILLATSGMHLMASAANLMMLFLGLEIASISLYVVAGFTRDRLDADESAMKYFLLGSFASAVFLYGVALTFAATGSTFIYGADSINGFLGETIIRQPGILLAGIALLVVGLGFKVSAAPFHMWAPDVYQGAPTGAVGLMAAGVKIAGFAAIGRVLVGAFPAYIDDWAPAIAGLAAISAVVGTVLAIAQNDIKRMLAYSGVAHAGFILTGVVAGVPGLPPMWFYLATYSLQLLGAFTVVAVIDGADQGPSPFSSYTGLAARAPMLAAVLATMMLAMGGIPFTSGFVGKAGVFAAAIDAGYLWLAIVAILASVAGLFFYLRIVVLMYFQEPAPSGPGAALGTPQVSAASRAVLIIVTVVTIVAGIVPWPWLNAVQDALPF